MYDDSEHSMDTVGRFGRMTFTMDSRLPRESIQYWNDLARLVLTVAAALATILYLLKGGNLIRLSPAT